jgi:hypothetical protein
MAADMIAATHMTPTGAIEAGLAYLAAVIAADGAEAAMPDPAARDLAAAAAHWHSEAAPVDLVALPCPQPAARWHLERLRATMPVDAASRARRAFHARLLGFLLAPDRPHFRPLVTILIPVHNRAALCVEAVESCLAQSWRPMEILVVDDGSTDDLDSALRPFGDEVRLLRKPNGGVSSARNAGIAAARGDFIQFLDSDNLLLPDAVALKVAGFAAIADAELCCCSVLIERAKVWTHDTHRAPNGSESCPTRGLLPALARQYPFFVSSVMIARWAARDGVAFEEDLRRYEDLRYWMALALRGTKVIGIARHLAIRRVLSNSLGGRGRLTPEPPLVTRMRNLCDVLASQDNWRYAGQFYGQLLGQHVKLPVAAEPTETLRQAASDVRAAIQRLGQGAGLSGLPVLAEFRDLHRTHMRDPRLSRRRDPCSRLIGDLEGVIAEALARTTDLTPRDIEFWLGGGDRAVRQFLIALGPWKRGARRRCAEANAILRRLPSIPSRQDVVRYRKVRRKFGATVARLVLRVLPAT